LRLDIWIPFAILLAMLDGISQIEHGAGLASQPVDKDDVTSTRWAGNVITVTLRRLWVRFQIFIYGIARFMVSPVSEFADDSLRSLIVSKELELLLQHKSPYPPPAESQRLVPESPAQVGARLDQDQPSGPVSPNTGTPGTPQGPVAENPHGGESPQSDSAGGNVDPAPPSETSSEEPIIGKKADPGDPAARPKTPPPGEPVVEGIIKGEVLPVGAEIFPPEEWQKAARDELWCAMSYFFAVTFPLLCKIKGLCDFVPPPIAAALCACEMPGASKHDVNEMLRNYTLRKVLYPQTQEDAEVWRTHAKKIFASNATMQRQAEATLRLDRALIDYRATRDRMEMFREVLCAYGVDFPDCLPEISAAKQADDVLWRGALMCTNWFDTTEIANTEAAALELKRETEANKLVLHGNELQYNEITRLEREYGVTCGRCQWTGSIREQFVKSLGDEAAVVGLPVWAAPGETPKTVEQLRQQVTADERYWDQCVEMFVPLCMRLIQMVHKTPTLQGAWECFGALRLQGSSGRNPYAELQKRADELAEARCDLRNFCLPFEEQYDMMSNPTKAKADVVAWVNSPHFMSQLCATTTYLENVAKLQKDMDAAGLELPGHSS
jgi:hypothetical protein